MERDVLLSSHQLCYTERKMMGEGLYISVLV